MARLDVLQPSLEITNALSERAGNGVPKSVLAQDLWTSIMETPLTPAFVVGAGMVGLGAYVVGNARGRLTEYRHEERFRRGRLWHQIGREDHDRGQTEPRDPAHYDIRVFNDSAIGYRTRSDRQKIDELYMSARDRVINHPDVRTRVTHDDDHEAAHHTINTNSSVLLGRFTALDERDTKFNTTSLILRAAGREENLIGTGTIVSHVIIYEVVPTMTPLIPQRWRRENTYVTALTVRQDPGDEEKVYRAVSPGEVAALQEEMFATLPPLPVFDPTILQGPGKQE